jgi:cytochrome c biogenesis protein CcmG/thiol:disulfide interchange protein DsbE
MRPGSGGMKANQRQEARHKFQFSRLRHIWRRGKWWFIVGGVAGAIALLAVVSSALSGPEAKGTLAPVSLPTSQGSGGAVSSSLPNFSLALYQGAEILGAQQPRFHDLLGKQPLILNFWASNCPPCAAEIPEFEKVWRKYKGQVLFFGLDVGQFAGLGGPEDSRRELRSLGVTYPAAPAPDIAAVQGLQVRALPSTYFIDRDGAINKQWVGILNEKKLTELVEELLRAN